MTMDLPDWVTFPDEDWVRITPAEAGLDPGKFDAFIGGLDIRGASSAARTTPATSGARC